jgi:hypothetical protein
VLPSAAVDRAVLAVLIPPFHAQTVAIILVACSAEEAGAQLVKRVDHRPDRAKRLIERPHVALAGQIGDQLERLGTDRVEHEKDEADAREDDTSDQKDEPAPPRPVGLGQRVLRVCRWGRGRCRRYLAVARHAESSPRGPHA